MAARLEWKADRLFLGPWPLARVRHDGKKCDGGVCCDYVIHGDPSRFSGPYQEAMDAAQDCDSEVRRLLKESGVDCE